MKNVLRIILMLNIWLAACLTASADQKHILVLSSYHPSFPTFFQQIEAVKDTFSDSSVLIDIEFLDSKRFTTETARRLFQDLLRYKFINLEPYDGVITTDDYALIFVLRNQQELFPGIPVAFCGVNDQEKAIEQNKNPEVTGVIESVSMEENLKLIVDLFPRTRSIYAITDGSESGRGDLHTFNKYKDSFPQKVLSLENLSFSELGRTVGNLPPDSAVLLLSAYTDKPGNSLDFYDSLKIILSHAAVPVFHLWSHGIGEGILGGKIISQYDQAREASKILKKVLFNKADISIIPVIKTSPNVYMFDYTVMLRFGIKEGDLPKDSIILNKPESFIRKNLKLILLVLFVLLFQSLLIILLIRTIQRNRDFASNLKQSKQHFQDLFNYAPVALFEEDFSEVKKFIDALAIANSLKNKNDLNSYFKEHPDHLKKCTSLIQVLDVNLEAIHLFEARNKGEIIKELPKLLPREEMESFRQQLCTLYTESEKYSGSVIRKTLKDNTLWTNVHVVVAPPAKELWDRIYIGIENTTESKEFQLQLEESLKEKDILLKEIHHRVNNNLALISSILNLEILKSDKKETIQVLKDSMHRIKTISLVHRKLYRNNSLYKIELRDYVQDLAGELIQAYSTQNRKVEFTLTALPLHMERETVIPLGLIINEIVSNSLKHAFGDSPDEQRSISISFSPEHNGTQLELTISDNGTGFSQKEMTKALEQQSMGLTIIKTLLKQLSAAQQVDTTKGTSYKLYIPLG